MMLPFLNQFHVTFAPCLHPYCLLFVFNQFFSIQSSRTTRPGWRSWPSWSGRGDAWFRISPWTHLEPGKGGANCSHGVLVERSCFNYSERVNQNSVYSYKYRFFPPIALSSCSISMSRPSMKEFRDSAEQQHIAAQQKAALQVRRKDWTRVHQHDILMQKDFNHHHSDKFD